MANTTNFGWETPDDTDLVKDGALAMRTLGNAIDTSFVDLKGGTTGQVLSKNSNTDLDFTWVTGGDITEVQAGTGISVASGTGPIPVVTNTAPGGLVFIKGQSFSAASTVNVDDAFSATYNNYKIVLSATASTSPVSVAMRMRVGGTTNSSANYNQLQVIQATSNYYAATATTGNTSWTEVALCLSTSPRTSTFFEVYNPFETTNTAGLTIFSKGFTGSPEFQLYAWGMSVTTSYTGFALIASTGNITGTVAVYGMRNS